MMAFGNKTFHLLYNGDSYEIVVDQQGTVNEVWRYANNQTCSPAFLNYEWLDEPLKELIHDRVVREMI